MRNVFVTRTLLGVGCMLVLCAVTGCHCSSADRVDDAAVSYPDPTRWSKEARAFEQQDQREGHPENAVLFVGSSSIVNWSTAEAFPDYPVINRGFGGSIMADSVYYVEPFVLKYRPKLVVVYAGDNDCAEGIPAEYIVRDFRRLADEIHTALPDTEIICLSIKLSDSREHLWPQMRQVNARYKKYAKTKRYITYVDVDTVLRQADGTTDPACYVPDRLHLSEKGYSRWNQLLAPIIRERYMIAMKK